MDCLAVSAGLIAFLIVLLVPILRRSRQNRRQLANRVEQLDHRLQEQIIEQGIEPSKESARRVSESVLQILRESESRPDIGKITNLSSRFSSIQPLDNSVALLSKRLAQLEMRQKNQDCRIGSYFIHFGSRPGKRLV